MNYLPSPLLALFAGLLLTSPVFAKKKQKTSEEWTYTDQVLVKHTPVKNQNRSGTCWSFSGCSLLEAEMIRKGVEPTDLSPLFVVYHAYVNKAIKHVRMHGHSNLNEGGSFHDVIYMIRDYGMMPYELYRGTDYGTFLPVHGELNSHVQSLAKNIVKNPNRKISTAWKKALKAILDSYLGKIPKTFTYKEKSYTPKSFVTDYCKLNMEDYVSLSSFTHHPFYSPFIIEVPDNWIWGKSYNLPLQEMMQIIDHALDNGYSIAWAADVSEKGYIRKESTGIVPHIDTSRLDEEQCKIIEEKGYKHWEKEFYKTLSPSAKEQSVTQEMRQEAYDNYETTDDHGMHLVGYGTDNTGKKFYKVKNSWGCSRNQKGYDYFSPAYLQYKTISIVLHKEAIPQTLKAKLGL